MPQKRLEELKKRLYAKNIHDLRQVGRAVGLSRPADGQKEALINNIMSVADGSSEPCERTKRGAPPKSEEYDRAIVAEIFRCREIILYGAEVSSRPTTVAVSSVEGLLEVNAGGILGQLEGKWYLGAVEGGFSVFVNDRLVKKYLLRSGDFVSGQCRRTSEAESFGLVTVDRINGYSPQTLPARFDFNTLPARYPDKRLKISDGSGGLGEDLDLLSPLAAGQRSLITGGHGCGKTSVLKSVLRGAAFNNPDLKLIVLLIDALPEEAEELRTSFPGVDLFSSGMEAGVAAHVHTAGLALEYAKRRAELGGDVILAVDGLTNLARAYGLCAGRGAPDLASAVDGVKKILAAAKNAGQCSLTVIATLVEGFGEGFADEVYASLEGFGNMRIALSGREEGLPHINAALTYAYGADRLLSVEELEVAAALRSGKG